MCTLHSFTAYGNLYPPVLARTGRHSRKQTTRAHPVGLVKARDIDQTLAVVLTYTAETLKGLAPRPHRC